MRLSVAAAVLSLSTITLATADPAVASIRRPVEIPAQSLEEALKSLARIEDIHVMFVSEDIGNRKTAGVTGSLTTDEALTELLKGTGLTYSYLDTRTITVVPQQTTGESSPGARATAPTGRSDGQRPDGQGAQSKSFWDRFRVAEVGQTESTNSSVVRPQGDGQAEDSPVVLEEVLVTAQKRMERLQDTPVPVSVVDTQSLTENDQVRLQDFYSSVPGLSMTTGVLSNEFLSIRGISNQIARGSQTVGVIVDDAPFGMNTGVQVADIDPGDLDHIEVLRGPQGTLYGSSSMGGLLKYVMAEPSTSGFSARVQAGTSTIYNAAKLGYNVRGSANIPISDTLAVRVSAFTREDPGYIDDVETHQEGVNLQRASGGHLAALWRPADGWSLKFNAFYSETVAQGVNDSDVPTDGYPQTANLQDLQQYRAWGSGYSDTQVQQYSATLDGKIAGIDVKSITAYNKSRTEATADYSTYFSGLAQQTFNVSGAIAPQLSPMQSFSQELRLSGTVGHRLDWLAGGFFTHQDSDVHDSIQPEDPLTGVQSAGNLFYESYIENYKEYAGFVDLTFHVADQFDIQVGGRESHVYQSYSYYSIGDLNGSPTAVYTEPTLGQSANAFTYLFTPSYKITPDTMVYARLASGFRAGTLNPTATGASFGGIPLAADPDKTYNYEIGVKSDFLEHRLSLDASLYYIDWKHIQLLVIETVNGLQNSFTTNGGDAKSDGLELSLTARPLTGLKVSGWIDYDNAVLKDGFPTTSPFVGNGGDRLPFTSRFSAHASLQQEFPLWGDVKGFAGGSIDYLGDRLGDFQVAGVGRQIYPAYAKADLQAGVKFNAWTVNAYANNVTDRRGMLSSGVDFPPPGSSVTFIQPRLIGLNAIWTY